MLIIGVNLNLCNTISHKGTKTLRKHKENLCVSSCLGVLVAIKAFEYEI
jgi:hypothetical protein